MPKFQTLGSALSVPWSLFVAAFLYYVALTLVAIGGDEVSLIFIAVSYLMPVGVYLAILANKAFNALSRLEVELWPVSTLVLH